MEYVLRSLIAFAFTLHSFLCILFQEITDACNYVAITSPTDAVMSRRASPPTYVNALHPLAHAEEGPLAGDVIEQHHTVRPPEVRLSDGSEPFLTCGVTAEPELQSVRLPEAIAYGLFYKLYII